MIRPHKYLDLNNNIIIIGAKILSAFKNNKKQRYEFVFQFVIEEMGDNSKYIFSKALSFLYLLGKIEYIEESDELELIV